MPIYHTFKKIHFKSSKNYWDKRYLKGGDSGQGSKGILKEFKSHFIANFVKENNITSIIDFGCGDGEQVERILELVDVQYTGLDVSPKAIKKCINRLGKRGRVSFFLYDPEAFYDSMGIFKHDLALSLDVIYHLVEDEVFEKYMRDLFNSARKYVIIYSCDKEEPSVFYAPHVRPRKFTEWVKENIQGWKLRKIVSNPYPHLSWSNFYVYERIS